MNIVDMRAVLGLGDEVSDIEVITRYGEYERANDVVAAIAAVPDDPFAIANGEIFQSPGTVEAEYDDGMGEMLPIRMIRMRGTADLVLNDQTIVADKDMALIQRSDVAKPAKGHRLFVGDDEFRIIGRPRIDLEGLNWACEIEPLT